MLANLSGSITISHIFRLSLFIYAFLSPRLALPARRERSARKNRLNFAFVRAPESDETSTRPVRGERES